MPFIIHTCTCGKDYECPFCGTEDAIICPTISSDEDANLCHECLDRLATESMIRMEATL